jgi:hypothetical protein
MANARARVTGYSADSTLRLDEDLCDLLRRIATALYSKEGFVADRCPRCEDRALLVFRRKGKVIGAACGSCAHAALRNDLLAD